jgi:hypothetical protein
VVGDFGECVAADQVSVASFQSNNASGKLEKDYYEFEAIDMDIAGVRRPQLAAVSDPCGPVNVEPEREFFGEAPPATWLASPPETKVGLR